MLTIVSSWRTKLTGRTTPFLLAAIPLLVGSPSVSADANCSPVNGHFTERALSGPTCTSPVGVCTEGTYSGALGGNFVTVVSTFTPTPDTPITSVFLFTADSTIHARVRGREGDLFIENAGAFHTTGAGEIVDLQTIVGAREGLPAQLARSRPSGRLPLPPEVSLNIRA